MIIYNNNDWGPEITLEKCECENCECDPCTNKQILDNIHSRIVNALNTGDRNAEIIHKNS